MDEPRVKFRELLGEYLEAPSAELPTRLEEELAIPEGVLETFHGLDDVLHYLRIVRRALAAPRPEPPPSPLAEFPDLLDLDIPCLVCRYNLRNSVLGHGCPECGEATLGAITAALIRTTPPTPPTPDAARSWEECQQRWQRRIFAPAAILSDLSIDALLMVRDALDYAVDFPKEALPTLAFPTQDCCRRLHDYAVDAFGEPAAAEALLRSWHLDSRESVERAVGAMIEAGLLELQHDEA